MTCCLVEHLANCFSRWPFNSRRRLAARHPSDGSADFPMSPIVKFNNIYYFEVTINKNKNPNYVPSYVTSTNNSRPTRSAIPTP